MTMISLGSMFPTEVLSRHSEVLYQALRTAAAPIRSMCKLQQLSSPQILKQNPAEASTSTAGVLRSLHTHEAQPTALSPSHQGALLSLPAVDE
ncbi:hypothetical protein ABBQ38_013264 [Trebouxia sp. C0009 RCD-2024]